MYLKSLVTCATLITSLCCAISDCYCQNSNNTTLNQRQNFTFASKKSLFNRPIFKNQQDTELKNTDDTKKINNDDILFESINVDNKTKTRNDIFNDSIGNDTPHNLFRPHISNVNDVQQQNIQMLNKTIEMLNKTIEMLSEKIEMLSEKSEMSNEKSDTTNNTLKEVLSKLNQLTQDIDTIKKNKQLPIAKNSQQQSGINMTVIQNNTLKKRSSKHNTTKNNTPYTSHGTSTDNIPAFNNYQIPTPVYSQQTISQPQKFIRNNNFNPNMMAQKSVPPQYQNTAITNNNTGNMPQYPYIPPSYTI